ncbi:ester cyclase [Brucella sp. BE17]|uniref:ester cyclase n=1 Tax=Brucella sp. BE17 TaxID=3142977 RepID=UPI0031BA872A
MTRDQLSDLYRRYIECLNRQDWERLHQFVHDEVEHNGNAFGLSGYRKMLQSDFRAIPDLNFKVDLLVSDPPRVASRLLFDCTPKGMLFDLPINGKRVKFSENVFYEFSNRRIRKVWSIIDKTAIAQQL